MYQAVSLDGRMLLPCHAIMLSRGTNDSAWSELRCVHSGPNSGFLHSVLMPVFSTAMVSDSLVIPQVVMTPSGSLKMPQRPASSAPVKMVRSSDSRGRRA